MQHVQRYHFTVEFSHAVRTARIVLETTCRGVLNLIARFVSYGERVSQAVPSVAESQGLAASLENYSLSVDQCALFSNNGVIRGLQLTRRGWHFAELPTGSSPVKAATQHHCQILSTDKEKIMFYQGRRNNLQDVYY